LEQGFVYRKTSLPDSDTKKTSVPQILQLNEELRPPENHPWILRDKAPFGQINGRNGRKRLLFPEEAARIKKARQPEPKPPHVQILLHRAHELKKRLDSTPGLTQTALAEELGISRVRITQILNLLKLAPTIQGHILSMPPTPRQRGLITERHLRQLHSLSD
jgi:hypothetical protein